jgi:hypothetical protein
MEIMISSPEFSKLCVVCGKEFLETMRAVGELTVEMAEAYGVNLFKEGTRALPGIPLGEIEIRRQLNRIKQKCPA